MTFFRVEKRFSGKSGVNQTFPKKEPSRGSIRSSKSQLFTANTELKRKICELEAKKVEELVLYAFDQLPLPVKKKLGLD